MHPLCEDMNPNAHESVWSIWIDEKFGKALLICMLVCVFTCLMFLSFIPMWYYHLFASANSVFALAYVKHHDGIGGKRARKKLWNFNSIHAQSEHNAPMISQSRRDKRHTPATAVNHSRWCILTLATPKINQYAQLSGAVRFFILAHCSAVHKWVRPHFD